MNYVRKRAGLRASVWKLLLAYKPCCQTPVEATPYFVDMIKALRWFEVHGIFFLFWRLLREARRRKTHLDTKNLSFYTLKFTDVWPQFEISESKPLGNYKSLFSSVVFSRFLRLHRTTGHETILRACIFIISKYCAHISSRHDGKVHHPVIKLWM